MNNTKLIIVVPCYNEEEVLQETTLQLSAVLSDMEQNGKITVIKKRASSPPTLKDIGISAEECGICHIIVADGKIDKHGLKQSKKSREWLTGYLSAKKLLPDDVYIMTIDDADKIILFHYGSPEVKRIAEYARGKDKPHEVILRPLKIKLH